MPDINDFPVIRRKRPPKPSAQGPHGLTSREAEVIKAIYRHLDSHGVPPSMEELAQALGMSQRSGAMYQVKNLIRKGWLHAPAGSRTLRLKGVKMAPMFDLCEEAAAAARLMALLEVPLAAE